MKRLEDTGGRTGEETQVADRLNAATLPQNRSPPPPIKHKGKPKLWKGKSGVS